MKKAPVIPGAVYLQKRGGGCTQKCGEKNCDSIKQLAGMAVGGIYACGAACRLAGQYKVEMPITFGLKACLDGRITPMEVIDSLMKRSPKTENC